MQRHEAIEALKLLGLGGMATAFDEAVTQGVQRSRTIMEVVTDLIQAETTHRHAASIRYRMKAAKLPNGELACLTSDARVVRLDAQGKELFSFAVPLGMRLFGGRIHMLSSGRVLIPHHSENKVVEYDGQGKAVWENRI